MAPPLITGVPLREAVARIGSRRYWEELCPYLHIDNKGLSTKRKLSKGERVRVKQELVEEGYSKVGGCELLDMSHVELLRRGIEDLVAEGWPPTFIGLYDECWQAVGAMQNNLKQVTDGRNSCNFDVVAWHVDPSKGQHGFSPHRDRQPEDWVPRGLPHDVEATFVKDEEGNLVAKYVTCWLALTEASPDNSCLNFVPAPHDPGYYQGDVEEQDPMERVFSCRKEAYQHIRSVPLSPGGCTFHTHRIIHWGSAAKPNAASRPRISLSCAFSTSDFEKAYVLKEEARSFSQFDFDLRLALCAGQMINYGDRFLNELGPHVLRVYHRVFSSLSHLFSDEYQAEIGNKYVQLASSVQDKMEEDINATAKKPGEEDEDEDEDEDILDSALDSILSAKVKGMKGFVDDFEDIYGHADFPADRKEMQRKQRKQLPAKFFGRVSRIRGILKGQGSKKKRGGKRGD
mmetsp:Transcript_19021/g.62534  ORF Transcript_19021/g.62534 Transcript_19021/m.62534 type:complete len:458 (-) Transcript_19021:1090-2463(-)